MLPYFLTRGRHLKKDIPAILEGLIQSLSGLSLQLAPHIGYHDQLVGILAQRAEQ